MHISSHLNSSCFLLQLRSIVQIPSEESFIISSSSKPLKVNSKTRTIQVGNNINKQTIRFMVTMVGLRIQSLLIIIWSLLPCSYRLSKTGTLLRARLSIIKKLMQGLYRSRKIKILIILRLREKGPESLITTTLHINSHLHWKLNPAHRQLCSKISWWNLLHR